MKFRKVIFLLCLLTFLLAAPSLIFYNQGYRLSLEDIKNGRIKFTQTGGIYLKTFPRQVEIYIDGVFSKKTDFFFGSALIENLLPGNYEITVMKEDLHAWKKKLEVKEKEVTDARSIILFPENPEFKLIPKTLGEFWLAPDGKSVISKEDENGTWTLKMYRFSDGSETRIVGENEIAKGGAEFLGLEISDDSKELRLDVKIGKQEKKYAVNLTEPPPYVFVDNTTSTLQPPALALTETPDGIYYLDNAGNLYKSAKDFSSKEKMTGDPFPVLPEGRYKIYVFGSFIFLQENDRLMQFNSDEKYFEKIFDRLAQVKLSPYWKDKMVYASESEIWVMYLAEIGGNPPKEHGQSVFLARFSQKIRDIFWLNDDYLVFSLGSEIKAMEIDNRSGVNIVDLAEYENPSLSFDAADKKLYVVSSGKIYSAGGLIP